MIASVRFWRAIRACLPNTPAGRSLHAKLDAEPRQARKRHMPWPVDLTPAEDRLVRSLMDDPPTPYVAFVVQHHRLDALTKTRPTYAY